MICDACGRDCAKIYRVETEGRTAEVTVCPDCYRKLYTAREEKFGFLNGTEERGKKVCPACGTRYEEFENTGLLGCADCYKTFRAEILPTVRYIQWGVQHKGDLPSKIAETRYDMVRELVTEQNALQTEVTHALKAKDFNRAEQLKRRIAEIKNILNGVENV